MKNYFSESEISCPCGCGAFPIQDSLDKLNEVRFWYGKPIYIEQGATCDSYSVNKLKRKHTSTHIKNSKKEACAFDIKSKTFSSKEDYFKFIKIAIDAGFTGFGQGSFWLGCGSDKRLHIDTKRSESGDFRSWTYS